MTKPEHDAASKIQRFFKRHVLGKQKFLEKSISISPSKLLIEMFHLRFQCMRAVAAAKFPRQLPIEDKAQEARVIASVKGLATARGITNLDVIERIFQHTMTLSKEVQRPYYDNIWDRDRRDMHTLVNHAHTQLRHIVSQAGLTHINSDQEVLMLARDIIQHANQMIIDILSQPEKHRLNEMSQEELTHLFTTILANYMTPPTLKYSNTTIQALTSELTSLSAPI